MGSKGHQRACPWHEIEPLPHHAMPSSSRPKVGLRVGREGTPPGVVARGWARMRHWVYVRVEVVLAVVWVAGGRVGWASCGWGGWVAASSTAPLPVQYLRCARAMPHPPRRADRLGFGTGCPVSLEGHSLTSSPRVGVCPHGFHHGRSLAQVASKDAHPPHTAQGHVANGSA